MSPMKGVMRFGKKGKINRWYVGPYRIPKRISYVAYELTMPTELAAVHPIFHIFLLKKYVGNLASIVPLKSVDVKDSLTYEEIPVEILDRRVCRFRNKIYFINGFVEESVREEATWEAEAAMMAKYPHLFPSDSVLA
ncbi:hypothetical protein MTR67_039585 [Solanum verrucosum]|uniref:Tf2-1-like SH3-like domain-containing protein n=1 Tax=Solanum verrucosum TaxID=315347 RepID=A0AAF0UI75_SOLVR|nr:hypothetical protein MTR67_039585 [Solanum verrucosum]